MARDKNDFTKSTRETLAKRAGQKCSNPSCPTITTGPHTEDNKYIDIGVAAHIRGARPISARYDPGMIPEERSKIRNGIWLCWKCATLIDRDELKYTVEVLHDWKINHEREIRLNQSGKSIEWQIRDSERKLKPFKEESLTVQQVILDQSEYWQLYLARELLRSKLPDIMREFNDLNRGLIYRKVKYYPTVEQFAVWLKEKTYDLSSLFKLIEVAIKEDFNEALRDHSNPAQSLEIKRAVDKILKFCWDLLDWDIDCHFTLFPEQINPLKQRMQGWSHQYLYEINRLPDEIARNLRRPKPKDGAHIIEIKLTFKGMEGADDLILELDELTNSLPDPKI